ncbi:MAG: SoxR reducing system RseC family protein [Rhodocyclaceae bacterium]|nr:SoxR reducing system RseC family protein [Rhodocyclaceae bacterium]
MMEQLGIVRGISGTDMLIECRRERGCGHCAEAGGCGGSSACARPLLLRVPNRCGASVGDRLVVSVPEGTTLAAACICYLLPLFAGLVAALAVMPLADGPARDLAVALAFCAGLAAGLVAARRAGRRLGSRGALDIRRADATDHPA